jgi:hypothetical protein
MKGVLDAPPVRRALARGLVPSPIERLAPTTPLVADCTAHGPLLTSSGVRLSKNPGVKSAVVRLE